MHKGFIASYVSTNFVRLEKAENRVLRRGCGLDDTTGMLSPDGACNFDVVRDWTTGGDGVS